MSIHYLSTPYAHQFYNLSQRKRIFVWVIYNVISTCGQARFNKIKMNDLICCYSKHYWKSFSLNIAFSDYIFQDVLVITDIEYYKSLDVSIEIGTCCLELNNMKPKAPKKKNEESRKQKWQQNSHVCCDSWHLSVPRFSDQASIWRKRRAQLCYL